MVLIEIRDGRGHVVRWCGARCHNADPATPSRCICGGAFHGIARRGIDPAAVDLGTLAAVRESVALAEGQYLQLRIGA
jgi:hypothetical protein